MISLHGSLDIKSPTATWNFKMSTIFQDDCRVAHHVGHLNDTFCHINVFCSSKDSVKRGCLTVFCLTSHPRPVRFGKTCQELPPTGIALGVHWGTQALLPRQGNSHKRVFFFKLFFNVLFIFLFIFWALSSLLLLNISLQLAWYFALFLINVLSMPSPSSSRVGLSKIGRALIMWNNGTFLAMVA